MNRNRWTVVSVVQLIASAINPCKKSYVLFMVLVKFTMIIHYDKIHCGRVFRFREANPSTGLPFSGHENPATLEEALPLTLVSRMIGESRY